VRGLELEALLLVLNAHHGVVGFYCKFPGVVIPAKAGATIFKDRFNNLNYLE